MIDSGLKEKLLGALQDVVENYNSGMDEAHAIAKSASDRNFNKAQTERLCEMYNTSRTLYHFNTNPTEKAASFPLVSKTDVLGLLFDTDNTKMASEFKRPAERSVGYNEPETDFAFCKSAEEFPFEPTFKPSLQDMTDIDTNTRRMSVQLSKLQKEADHLNADAGIESERAHQALSKLAGMLVTHYSTGDMQKVAAVVGILAGKPQYIGVFEDLSNYLPEYVMSCDVKVAHVIDERLVSREMELVEKASWCMKQADLLHKEAKAKLELKEKAEKDFNALIDGHYKAGKHVNEMDRFLSDDFIPLHATKQADFIGDMAGYGKAMSDTSKKYVHQLYEDLNSRTDEVDREISDINKRFVNLHREMILTDLINNDPYLREEDPKTIAQYYTHFADLSPELANNKEVARSVLRQAIHNGGGGYSPFDADAFIGAEKTLKEIRGTLPAKRVLSPLSDDSGDNRNGGKK